MTKKIPYIIQAIVFIAAICFLLLSCGTTKYVDKEVIKVDSATLQQNEGLQQTLIETIERYEKERERWLTTGVLFDTIYRDTGRIVNKITFDNGKIKTIEGRIIAVNQDLYEKTAELLDAHSTIDDLSMQLEKAETQLSKKVQTITKEVRRSYIPWWVWLIALAGFLLRHYWPIIRHFIKLKFQI